MIKRTTIKHLSVIKSRSLDGFLFRSLLICAAILTNSPSPLSQRGRAQCGMLRLFQTCYSIINRFQRFQLAGISRPFFSETKAKLFCMRARGLACWRACLTRSHPVARSQVWSRARAWARVSTGRGGKKRINQGSVA